MTTTEKALQNYKEIYKENKGKFDFVKEVKIRESKGGWRTKREENKFNIYCPVPMKEKDRSVFLHYLCHAEIMDKGWEMASGSQIVFEDKAFEVNPIDRKDLKEDGLETSYIWGITNRAMDSFFDFYVWKTVDKRFPRRVFDRTLDPICEVAASDEFADGLEERVNKIKLKLEPHITYSYLSPGPRFL